MTGDTRPGPEEHPTVVEDGIVHLDVRGEEQALDISDVQWDDAPAFILFWVLAGVVFTQFYTRYVLNDSLGWTEEIARYLLIGVTFVGCAMATRKGSHIAIEVFYLYMPRGMRRVVSAAVDLIVLGVYGWFTWLCIKLAMRTQSMMVSLELPKSTIYWVVAIGFAGMTLYQLRRAILHLRAGTNHLIDPPGV
jgi:TRAP-type C4-dicarboxylate transport system permease small subunit